MPSSSKKSKPSALVHQLTDLDLDAILAETTNKLHLIDLSDLALIRVDGEDAENFLQGQFSNDVSKLDQDSCQLHAYCNPKGRTLAIIRLMRTKQGFWLLLPEEISQSFMKRLKMFVLRAKVDIELDTDNRALGMLGCDAWNEFDTVGYDVKSIVPRKILIGDSNLWRSHLDSNAIDLNLCAGDLWQWLDIRSGIPQVYGVTLETFIPQTINLDLVEGISFKKGCYPGQEIVARVKYLGKVKQRMILCSAESRESITPGAEVFFSEKPGQKSGLVVDSVGTEKGIQQLTIMISTVLLAEGEIHVGSTSPTILTRLALPYEIPEGL